MFVLNRITSGSVIATIFRHISIYPSMIPKEMFFIFRKKYKFRRNSGVLSSNILLIS